MNTLNDLLDSATQKEPTKPALVTQTEKISYTQLRSQVLSIASGLAAAGIKKDDCVAIVHRNGPEFIIAYFALARLGAIAVPLNYMIQKADELAYMLNDCQAKGCVTQKEFLKGLRQAAVKCPTLKNLWISDAPASECSGEESPFSELAQAAKEQLSPIGVSETDTVSILYTSGTTGSPKGVMLTHRNLISNCNDALKQLTLKSSDVALCILPMFHSFAWTGNVLVCLTLNAKLVIAPAIVPPTTWLKLMGREGVTIFTAVPQVYAVLSKQATGLKGLLLRWWFFRRVHLAVSGAAPLSPAIAQGFEATFGVPVLEGYGLTETSPVVTLNTPKEHRLGSVGKPIPGVRIKIVDDSGAELKSGEEGEIYVKGDCVMKGYYNLPQATSEAITPDGWFKTGDVGVIDEDGFLFIRDRKKDMIIVKGLKVFSAQLEVKLLENSNIEEVAVVGIPDEHGDEIIKAFIVLKPDAKITKAELMQYCRENFDAYKRPRDIEIVKSLPKNALQKVLKRELRKQEIEKKAANSTL